MDLSYVKIRNFESTDLKFIMDLIKEHEWLLCSQDIKFIHETYGEGLFVAEMNGIFSGCIMAAKLSDALGFVGLFLVEGQKRRMGIGRQLLLKANAFLELKDNHRNCGLNAVSHLSDLYVRYGYNVKGWEIITYYMMIDCSLVGPIPMEGIQIIDFEKADFDKCRSFDQSIGGLSRSKYLEDNLENKNVIKKIAYEKDQVVGYGMITYLERGIDWRIAPLYAKNNKIAISIMNELIRSLKTTARFLLETPRPNVNNFAEWINHFDLKTVSKLGDVRLNQRQFSLEDYQVTTDQIYALSTTDFFPF